MSVYSCYVGVTGTQASPGPGWREAPPQRGIVEPCETATMQSFGEGCTYREDHWATASADVENTKMQNQKPKKTKVSSAALNAQGKVYIMAYLSPHLSDRALTGSSHTFSPARPYPSCAQQHHPCHATEGVGERDCIPNEVDNKTFFSLALLSPWVHDAGGRNAIVPYRFDETRVWPARNPLANLFLSLADTGTPDTFTKQHSIVS